MFQISSLFEKSFLLAKIAQKVRDLGKDYPIRDYFLRNNIILLS